MEHGLHQHILDGDLDAILKHSEDDLKNYRDKNGSSLLHYAAGCGHETICRYLLQFMDPELKSLSNERSPLHWASRNGYTNICSILVQEYGASADIVAKGQVTPLELAVWQCHLDTAKYLVEKLGADPHHPNSWGCTTSHWLGKCPLYDGEKDTCDLLEQTCDWLFQECNVEYNLPNHHGQTPLHKAAYAGNFIVAEYLCEKFGVIDTIRDNNGNTAADCAERSQNYELAKWLRRHASAEIHNAVQILGLKRLQNTTIPPTLDETRASYLQLAKNHHPDVSKSNSMQQWNIILDSYHLLRIYWTDDPESFDCQIRIRSRNSKLLEHERICWHSSWHEEQQSTQTKDSSLGEFESRLVRLLSSESFLKSGLTLAQLPREYEKNFHEKVPSPRDFGCRKLIQLLEKECPNIKVVVIGGVKKVILQSCAIVV